MQSICRDKCKIFVENCKEFKGTNAKYLWGLMQSICGDQGKVFVGTATNANAAISIRHPLPQYRECKALILVLLFRPRFTSCEWLPLFMMNTPPDIKRIACSYLCHLQLFIRYYIIQVAVESARHLSQSCSSDQGFPINGGQFIVN